MITVSESDPQYQQALIIARSALRGEEIERAGGATHYFAKSMMGHPPDWYWLNPQTKTGARTPCFETKGHLFFKIGLGK